MATLSFKEVRKTYPGGVAVIHGLEADVADGEFIVIVGPSGCGKSTLMRMVAGLETVTDGEILIDGKQVNHLEPAERDIAMVFQNYALYPHMSVYENMAYGLKIRGLGKSEIQERVQMAAEILELSHLLDRRPRQLSGGQRQRVAMGRAIVREPKVFLFDEPLSNLDAKLRVQMRTEIARLHQRLKTTVIYVTHDQVEAMTLAQRMIVMNAGNMEQFGPPEEVYQKPASTFVASFIGSPPMNLLRQAPGGRPGALLGIRPEHLDVVPAGTDGWDVQVDTTELLGAERLIYASLGGEPLIVRIEAGASPPEPGQTLRVAPRPGHVHWFDDATGKRL